jgi:hypothetical protein
MNDELALRRKARESIDKGILPKRSPQQTWGGPGTGLTCALCGASVDTDELEFEVEFGRDRYHLHRACFSAWDAERKAHGVATADEAASASPAATAVHASAANEADRVLSDRSSDGKIMVHGDKRAFKPGAA